MSRKPFGPLAYIPSVAAVRARLTDTRRLYRRLVILLKTAKRLERAGVATTRPASAGHAASRPAGEKEEG